MGRMTAAGLLVPDYTPAEQGLTAFSSGIQSAIDNFMKMRDYRQGEIDREESRSYREKELAAKQEANEINREMAERKMKMAEQSRADKAKMSGFLVGEGGGLEYDPEALEQKRAEYAMRPKDPYGYKAMQAELMQDRLQRAQREQTPMGKLEAMGGEQKKRFDNVVGSLNALKDIRSSIASEDSDDFLSDIFSRSKRVDVPFRGDTDYTSAKRNFSEFLGRMQSGGAINKEEEKRFREMLPTAFDSPDVAEKKIENIEFELQNRLKSFGISPEDALSLGYLREANIAEIGDKRGLLNEQKGLMRGLIEPDADATPKSSKAPWERYK